MGVEPTTFSLATRRSTTELRPHWMGWQGSNLRMPESKSGALPLGDIPKLERVRDFETPAYWLEASRSASELHPHGRSICYAGSTVSLWSLQAMGMEAPWCACLQAVGGTPELAVVGGVEPP